MKSGDRVRKRGLLFKGTVDAVTELGVRVIWDMGVAPKIRPKYCTPGELETC